VRGAAAKTPARPQNVGSHGCSPGDAGRGFTTSACGPPSAARDRERPAARTALVARPSRSAESLLDYYDAGATTVLIRGFDPLQDAIDFGRDLIPIIRPGSSAAGARACPPARGTRDELFSVARLTVERIRGGRIHGRQKRGLRG